LKENSAVYKFFIFSIIIIFIFSACSNTSKPTINPTLPEPEPGFNDRNGYNDIKDTLPDDEEENDSKQEKENDKGNKDTVISVGFSFENVISGLKNDSLGYPVAADQDKDGYIYILDIYSTNGLVKIFDYQGRYISKGVPLPSPKSQPVDMVVDDDGYVYLADMGEKAVLKYDGNELVEKIQLEENFHPRSLAFDIQGNLLVLSFDRVYVISTEGKFISSFGQQGEGDGELGAVGSEFYIGPSGIDVDSKGHIFVADTLNYRIQQFDPKGEFIKAYTFGQKVAPQDIAVDSNGFISVLTTSGVLMWLDSDGTLIDSSDLNVSLADGGYLSIARGTGDVLFIVVPEKHQVRVFSQGTHVYSIQGGSDEGFIHPNNLEIFGDRILVLASDPFSPNELNNRVIVYNTDGRFLWDIVPGYRNSWFLSPKAAAFQNDSLYLLDLDMISVFDRKGNFINSFGGSGSGPGDLGVFDNYGLKQGPSSIIAFVEDSLIISDTFNNRIQIISINGKYLHDFSVDLPGDIALGENDSIYVVLPRQGRIEKYSLEGNKVLEFGKPGLGEGEFLVSTSDGLSYGPEGIAVDRDRGLVYVSDTEAHRIQVFNYKGEFICSFGTFGVEQGFFHPSGLCLDDEGFLWLVDSSNHRVVKLRVDIKYQTPLS